MVDRALLRGRGSESTVRSLLADHSRLDGSGGVVGLSGNKSCRLLAGSMRCNGQKESPVLMEAMARRLVAVNCMLSVVEALERCGINAA